MIRPFTCLCVLLAAGSGLYLYQTKHRTLVLDQQIADVLKQADIARARTTELRAQYALLNQPQRLTELAGRFLSLRPMAVTQFVQLASLDQRLPPVQQFPRPGDAPVQAATAPASADNTTDDAAEDAADAAPLPAATASAGADIPIASAAPVPRATPARHDPAPHAEAEPPRAYAANLPQPRQPGLNGAGGDAIRQATRISDAGPAPRAHHAALPGNQFAEGYHAQEMPMAAPRPVASSVLATAALHPVGTPARPRITDAEAYSPAWRPARRAAPAYGGSMLGSSGAVAMAPPVPVDN